jgi:hypothetical protein
MGRRYRARADYVRAISSIAGPRPIPPTAPRSHFHRDPGGREMIIARTAQSRRSYYVAAGPERVASSPHAVLEIAR